MNRIRILRSIVVIALPSMWSAGTANAAEADETKPLVQADEFVECSKVTLPPPTLGDGYSDSARQSPCEANVELFEHGYVASGYDGDGFRRGVLVDPESRTSDEQYLLTRLLDGVSTSSVTEKEKNLRTRSHFNLYHFERNFRRLADDRNPWFEVVSTHIQPYDSDTPGVLKLAPTSASASGGNTGNPERCKMETGSSFRYCRRSPLDLQISTANNRPQSSGEWRHSASLRWRGVPGLLVDADIGTTRGAQDGRLQVQKEVSPKWTLVAGGQANDSEIIDPRLRRLNISSRGWGGEVGLRWNVMNCPQMPFYASFEGVERRSISNGLTDCGLSVRRLGDQPAGWINGKDLSVSLLVSHRQSRSYLLGQPFSFAPGAVDGLTRVTAARLTVDFLGRGRIGRDARRGWALSGQLGIVQGLEGTQTDLAGFGVPLAIFASPSPHFTVLRGQVGYARQLGFAGLDFYARVIGQYSRRALYASERMAIGGVGSVRGFAEAEILADRGAVGSVELSRNFSLTNNRWSERPFRHFDIGRFRLTAFLDGAVSETRDPGALTRNRLASIGGSLSWIPSDAISIDTGFARPIVQLSDRGGAGLTRQSFHFALTLKPLNLLARRGDRQ